MNNTPARGKRHKVPASIRLDAELMDALHTASETEFRTFSGLVHMILYNWLDSRRDNTVVTLDRQRSTKERP